MKPSNRSAIVQSALLVGTVGLVIGLFAPTWVFTSGFPGDRSSTSSEAFSIGSPGAYFQSYVLGPGRASPPQATLDLDIALWVDLALGGLASAVAIARGALAIRRESTPPLTQGASVVALGLALVAVVLLFAQGTTAYAPGTRCASCTAYSGGTSSIAWMWTPGVGTVVVLIAAVALAAALLIESFDPADPGRWSARLGGVGILAGIGLFSFVFGSNWQAWYPTGSPYLLLWITIVAVPVVSTVLATWRLRSKQRTGSRTPP